MDVHSINKAVDFLKEGGWLDYEVPKKFHFEEVDDYCECCGDYQGKTKEMVVDEYETRYEYIEPGAYTPDVLCIKPEIYKELLDGDI